MYCKLFVIPFLVSCTEGTAKFTTRKGNAIVRCLVENRLANRGLSIHGYLQTSSRCSKNRRSIGLRRAREAFRHMAEQPIQVAAPEPAEEEEKEEEVDEVDIDATS